MALNTIEALRQICQTCSTKDTDKFIGNQRFEARILNREESFAARRGILETSQMMSNGLMVAYPNAVDGAEWKWEEILPGVVQSRATGGLSKFTCGFDPQVLKKKHQIKRQQTERMYIHREECMLTYIGSSLQQGNSTGPVYIRNNDDLITIAESRQLIIDLMVNDMRAMARTVDGNTILGNWAGDNTTGTIINGAVSKYPHFDGVIKQALLQSSAAYYSSVDVTLPPVAGGAYFIKYYGSFDSAHGTVAEVVTAINGLKVDATGESLYSAVDLGGNVIRITANQVEKLAYDEYELTVYHSPSGNATDCDAFLPATIVENPMPYAEQPLMFNYGVINEANFHSYFKDVIKEWQRKIITLYENGQMPANIGEPYIACDPLVLIERDYSFLKELDTFQNAEAKLTRLNAMFPRFIPLKVLEGTGIWYLTVPGNIIYLTNFGADILGVTKIWHDEDCDTVKSKNEMLGNVLVADFALFATNAKGSPFESGLTPAYQPENLPHLAPEIRSNTVKGFEYESFRAGAMITYTDAGGGNVDLRLQDASFVPKDKSIQSYNWTIYNADGNGPTQPATQTGDVTVTLTQANYDAIQIVTLQVTLVSGETDIITIPNEKFIQV